MRFTLLIITLTAFISASAQCDCETIRRNDGTNIVQCLPNLVAGDNYAEFGLSLASNGVDNYISLSIRFLKSHQNVNGNLSIRLENNNLLTFKYVNSQMQYTGGSKMCNAIFLLSSDDSDLIKIKNSRIKNLSIKMEDGLLYTYNAKANLDVLTKQAIYLPSKSSRL